MSDRTLLFEPTHRDGLARLGRLHTAHGIVQTPTLLPVVNPNERTIPPSELYERFGVRMLITNAYILSQKEALRDAALRRGIHALLDFPGAVMTDSGAFQVSRYAAVDPDPIAVVAFQRDIGVDLGTVLDVISPGEVPYERATADVEETLRRVRAATDPTLRADLPLAGTVQGSVYPELRERCAAELATTDCALHPIGGVVPLLEAYRYGDVLDAVLAAQGGLHPGRPVHLFGAGHPMMLALACLLGCDLFDSAAYARFAAADRLVFTDGTRLLRDLAELPAGAPAFVGVDLQGLQAMSVAQRTPLLARYNLWATMQELSSVRQAISEGTLWELAAARCRAHPALEAAFRRLDRWKDLTGRSARPSHDQALFLTGGRDPQPPQLHLHRTRLDERYRAPPSVAAIVVLPWESEPLSVRLRTWWGRLQQVAPTSVLLRTPLGLVPMELTTIYPFGQHVAPPDWAAGPLAAGSGRAPAALAQRMVADMPRIDVGSFSDGALETTCQSLRNRLGLAPQPRGGPSTALATRWDATLHWLVLRATLDQQFGRPQGTDAVVGATAADAPLQYVAGSTGRLRNVLAATGADCGAISRNPPPGACHLLSLRAADGRVTLKLAAATMLKASVPAPGLRVVAQPRVREVILQGRNVMAGHVLAIDSQLRPGDECLVVDPDDGLLAVGRLEMAAHEVGAVTRGMAVRVRDGAGQHGGH